MNFGEIRDLVIDFTSRPDLVVQIDSRIKWAIKHAHTLVDQDMDLVDEVLTLTAGAATVGTFAFPARMRKPIALIPIDPSTGQPFQDKFIELLKATSLVEAKRRGEDMNTFYINSLGLSFKTDKAITDARIYYYAFPDLDNVTDTTEIGLMVEYGEALADLAASKVLLSVGENQQSAMLNDTWQTVATDIINAEGRQQYAN